ncbi:hypothetical protein NPIL_605251 [Nephila pilipes]|uniref:Uncharacterized protein n=1 Tax=Nephila pilipes TaxID=299642 RepID=A0A8X6Q922_NEPPI|nr:hypothetical protein NPIL_605251 [Nephila pilipes]
MAEQLNRWTSDHIEEHSLYRYIQINTPFMLARMIEKYERIKENFKKRDFPKKFENPEAGDVLVDLIIAFKTQEPQAVSLTWGANGPAELSSSHRFLPAITWSNIACNNLEIPVCNSRMKVSNLLNKRFY